MRLVHQLRLRVQGTAFDQLCLKHGWQHLVLLELLPACFTQQAV